MGILESYVGYRNCDGETRLTSAITVISLAHAEAALAAAVALDVPVTVISAPDAAGAVGPGWFDALIALSSARYPEAKVTAILDCGDAPGHALAAIRHGVKAIRYDGAARAQIDDIAGQAGAMLYPGRLAALDLQEVELAGADLFEACRDWLSRGGTQC